VNNASDRTKPGALMCLVADRLTASGIDVSRPTCEEGLRLTIGYEGVRCTLSISDNGYVEWECCPQGGGQADPKQIADLAATLLNGRAEDFPRQDQGYEQRGITLKGIVGLELKARGLDVDLEVYRDKHYFDAEAEIVITSPGTGDDGAKVYVTDEGSVTWARDYWAEAATIIWEPEYCGWIADPENVADAIAETITCAMPLARTAMRKGSV
jgi:hypothetical protein